MPTATDAPASSTTPTADPTETPIEVPTATPTETVLPDTVDHTSGPAAAEGAIALTIVQGDSIDFGAVRPGQGNPDGLGTGSYYYTAAGAGAVRITVTSDAPTWSGTCRVTADNGGAGASSMTVADGALAWRINDPSATDDDPTTAGGWTDFLTASVDVACIPSPPNTLTGPPYSYTYAYDYRLHVTRADTPGRFQAVVTYVVTS